MICTDRLGRVANEAAMKKSEGQAVTILIMATIASRNKSTCQSAQFQLLLGGVTVLALISSGKPTSERNLFAAANFCLMLLTPAP